MVSLVAPKQTSHGSLSHSSVSGMACVISLRGGVLGDSMRMTASNGLSVFALEVSFIFISQT